MKSSTIKKSIMKKWTIVCIIILSFKGYGQTTIATYPLQLTLYKTSNIIFPYEIISVDLGSKDIIAQKAKGADNVLQLEARKENFIETNLSVIVADGRLYPFIVVYNAKPSQLNISFAIDSQTQLTSETLNAAVRDKVINSVLHQKVFMNKSAHNDRIAMDLKGHLHSQQYILVQIENH